MTVSSSSRTTRSASFGAQLRLFPDDPLPQAELVDVLRAIRAEYWFLRNVRAVSHGTGRRMRHYRKVAGHKKRLLMAGVEKETILKFLRCCRRGPSTCPGCLQCVNDPHLSGAHL